MRTVLVVLGGVLVSAIACSDDPASQAPSVLVPADAGIDTGAPALDAGSEPAPSDGSTGITVSGKVVALGQPVAAAAVVIGARSATTAADGTFTIAAIEPPYELSVSVSPSAFTIYRGLTRRDPTVVVFGKSGPLLPRARAAASLGGTVMKVDGAFVSVSGPAAIMGQTTTSADGTYAIADLPQWYGESTTLKAKVHASIVTPDGKALYGSSSDVLVEQAKPCVAPAITLAALGDASLLTANADGPADLNVPAKITIRPGIRFATDGGGYALPQGNVALPASLARKLPRVSGAIAFEEVYFNRAALIEETSAARVTQAIAEANELDAFLAAPPRPTMPENGAANVGGDTLLGFSKFDGGLHRIALVAAGDGVTVNIITTSNLVALPPNLAKNVSYQWRVFGYGPLNSLDDDRLSTTIAYPEADLPPIAEVRIGASIPRTFTTAP